VRRPPNALEQPRWAGCRGSRRGGAGAEPLSACGEGYEGVSGEETEGHIHGDPLVGDKIEQMVKLPDNAPLIKVHS
jgi:hypothetical protein